VSGPALILPRTPIIDACPAIEPLAAEWDALVCRTGEPPFLRAGWFAAWWKAFGRGQAVVLTARRDRLVGVLPLRRRGGALLSLANVHSPGFGVLAEDEDAARALTAAVFARRPRVVALDHMAAHDPVLDELRASAAQAGHRMLVRPLQRSPYAALCPDDDVDARLGRKRARNLRRFMRRLETYGPVVVDVADGRERCCELLAEGFRVEGSGWKSARGTAIASRPETLRFYSELAAWAAEEGLLRLAFLRAGGVAVAFHLALEDESGYYVLKAGYDPDFAHCAPGRLLMRAMLARAMEAGLPRFDLLGGDDPWKHEWAPEGCDRVLVRTFAPTPTGAADRALRRAVLSARPAVKRTFGRVR
jgi:CelD/BcsL family acetyltransferase involved in cellulose biosynthesis